jgi:aminoglycoside 6'-N-acetyltransferase
MDHLSFVTLACDHFPLLHKWMQEPHVSQWWGEGKTWSFNDIQEKYHSYTLGYKVDHGVKKSISPFIIYFQGHPIGFIQIYNAFDFPREGYKVEDVGVDLSKPLAAIDFYIGDPEHIGRGIGAEVLIAFLTKYVFPHFEACLVDPEKSNKVAIKTYAKAGFCTLQERKSCIIMVANREKKKNPLIIFTEIFI